MNTTVVAPPTPAVSTRSAMEVLKSYVPENTPDPEFYINFVKQQVLGVDKFGQPRPFWDLFYFLNACKRTGLDPLTRQIYGVYRFDGKLGKEKMILQTGIDGLRLVAQRSGLYGGQDDVKYGEMVESMDVTHPATATVTVWRLNSITGERMPTVATAHWSEYAQTRDEYVNRQKTGNKVLMGLWPNKPLLMLAKCAEALALRKAFPQEMSGLYTEDELPVPMTRTLLPPPPTPTAPTAPAAPAMTPINPVSDNVADSVLAKKKTLETPEQNQAAQVEAAAERQMANLAQTPLGAIAPEPLPELAHLPAEEQQRIMAEESLNIDDIPF